MNTITICCPDINDKVVSMHPKVYLSLSQDKPLVNCPYCQKQWDINKLK
jgi:uncharacterized Zn-finger protein